MKRLLTAIALLVPVIVFGQTAPTVLEAYTYPLIDLTPSPPTSVTATAGNDAISLSWVAPLTPIGGTDADIRVYRIWRRLTSGSYGSAALDSVSSGSLVYTDQTAGHINAYQYTVVAVDVANHASSRPTDTTSRTGIDTPPPTVTNFTITPTNMIDGVGGNITLNWTGIPSTSDFAGYRIYRGTSANPTGVYHTTAANVSTISYIDAGTTVDTPYYYKIEALDQTQAGASTLSTPASASWTSVTTPPSISTATTAATFITGATVTLTGTNFGATRGTVYIGNNASYSAATYTRSQTVGATWTTTGTTFTMDQGTFTNGQTAWIYVINSTGTASVGRSVTIGVASSTPNITSVSAISGGITDGNLIAIAGTGFGSTGSSPLKFDKFEGKPANSYLNAQDPSWAIYGTSGAFYTTTTKHSGTMSAGDGRENSNGMMTNYFNFTPSNEAYISYWFTTANADITVGATPGDNGIDKLCRIGSTTSATANPQYTGPGVTVLSTMGAGGLVTRDLDGDGIYESPCYGPGVTDSTNPFLGYHHDTNANATNAGHLNVPWNTWCRVETYSKLSSPAGTANGEVFAAVTVPTGPNTAVRSVVRQTGIVNLDAAYAGVQLRSVLLGLMVTNQCSPWEVYIDDIYINNTQSRVELGDAATYSGCSHLEVQPVVNWSTNGSLVQFTLNQGTFANNATAYVYIVNSDGTVSNGQAIIINPTYATPTIASVSDNTPSNGQSITITGGGWGSSGPLVNTFDDFEGKTDGQSMPNGSLAATVGSWDDGPDNGTVKFTNLNNPRGNISSRHDHTGAYWVNNISDIFNPTQELFVSWWVLVPAGGTIPGTYNYSVGMGWKHMWITGNWIPGDAEYPGLSTGRNDFLAPTLSGAEGWSTGWNDVARAAYTKDYLGGGMSGVGGTFNFQIGYWHHLALWLKMGSGNAAVHLWRLTKSGGDLDQIINNNNVSLYPGCEGFTRVGVDLWGSENQANSYPQYDDVYIALGANSRARVEIGNNQTYLSCTDISICVPTQWTTGSITATVYTGDYTAGQTAYIFVTDGNGVTQTTGFPVTIQ